jgi:hypothetical protein
MGASMNVDRPIVFEMSPDEYDLLTSVVEFRLTVAEIRAQPPVSEREERLRRLYDRLLHAEWRH